MTREEVVVVLIKALEEILTLSGQPVPEITEETRPLADLPGFDSLNDLELTVILSRRSRLDDVMRLCRSGDGRRPLCIREVANHLFELGEK